jgi:ubiquitin carboxyl-terminal hydrolase L5
VALLNIVNNISNLELGQPLESFKDYTRSFDPVARGYAIDSFDFVRKIHNSFARDTDMLNIDSLMRDRDDRMIQKQKTQAANAAKAAKAAERAAARATNTESNTGTLRSNPSRKARTTKSVAEDEDGQDSGESGFHFVAYMPIGDKVWKLDGLDCFPTAIGTMEPGRDWLSVIQTSLSIRMAQYEEGQIQFSLMAVVQDPVIEDRRILAQNILSLQNIALRLNETSQDWCSYTSPDSEDSVLFRASSEYGLTDDMVSKAVMSESLVQQLRSDCPDSLLKIRQELMTNQAGCRAQVRDSQQAEHMDAEMSTHRRHGYGSFVKAWMQALANEGALKSLLGEELA